jgi:hypothetical protein
MGEPTGTDLLASISLCFLYNLKFRQADCSLTNDRSVLSSERASHMDRIVTSKQELISDHETQMEFDTKTE